MKKHFTTLFGILMVVILLASCAEMTDPVEEINDLIEDRIVLSTDDDSENHTGGPVKGQ